MNKSHIRKYNLQLIIALSLFIFSALCQAEMLPLPKDLAEEVSLLGNTLSDGHAAFYPEYSSYIDFTNNSEFGYNSSVAVLISIGGWGGGNTNNQYVAIYAINEKLDAHEVYKKYSLVSFLLIGGKADRLFDNMEISDEKLFLTGFSYGELDSLCCPTQPIDIKIRLGYRGWLEQIQSE